MVSDSISIQTVCVMAGKAVSNSVQTVFVMTGEVVSDSVTVLELCM